MLALAGLTVFSAAGSIYAKATGTDAAWIARMMGVVVMGLSVTVTVRATVSKWGQVRGWKLAGTLFGVGLASELVGIATGFPYGKYAYTGLWWPNVQLGSGLNYPLLLPFAWVMAAGAAMVVGCSWKRGIWGIVAGAALAALVDVPMEASMTSGLGYWHWIEAGPVFGAPVVNSLGWFVVSLLGGLIGLGVGRRAEGEGTSVGLREAAWVLALHLFLTGAVVVPWSGGAMGTFGAGVMAWGGAAVLGWFGSRANKRVETVVE